MPTPPGPNGRPPIRKLAIIVLIIAALWGIIFVGYNIHHAKRMNEQGATGQIPSGQTQTP